MKKQNYSNHTFYYPAHHFVFYPLLILASILIYRNYPDKGSWDYILLIFILAMLGYLSFMMRQHYALGNQNRIIRLEMRLRYYQITQHRFETVEDRLSISQIAALRFASDEELPSLLNRSIDENLSSKQIKMAVTNWTPDYMRV
jgi:hypothetical protein